MTILTMPPSNTVLYIWFTGSSKKFFFVSNSPHLTLGFNLEVVWNVDTGDVDTGDHVDSCWERVVYGDGVGGSLADCIGQLDGIDGRGRSGFELNAVELVLARLLADKAHLHATKKKMMSVLD